MCRFLSAILTRTGEVLCEPSIDSHEMLIKLFRVHESTGPADIQNFVKIEFTPGVSATDFDAYALRVDEESSPSWVDEEMIESTKKKLKTILKGLVHNDPGRTILIGGAYFFGEKSKIIHAPGVRVLGVAAGANLNGANLSGADLSGASLHGANLVGAYLNGANLSGADLSDAYLSDAYLSGAYLGRANLSGANLNRAYLSRAYLSRANLKGANLSDAYLSGAYLSGANLSGAYLSRANLNGANLTGAYRPTGIPDGWTANENGVLSRK